MKAVCLHRLPTCHCRTNRKNFWTTGKDLTICHSAPLLQLSPSGSYPAKRRSGALWPPSFLPPLRGEAIGMLRSCRTKRRPPCCAEFQGGTVLLRLLFQRPILIVQLSARLPTYYPAQERTNVLSL